MYHDKEPSIGNADSTTHSPQYAKRTLHTKRANPGENCRHRLETLCWRWVSP